MKIRNTSLACHGSGAYYGFEVGWRLHWVLSACVGGYGWIHGPGGCWRWLPEIQVSLKRKRASFSWLAGSVSIRREEFTQYWLGGL